jgi:NADH-quinone oxidoreductase subunit M
MSLAWLIAIPVLGGLLAWLAERVVAGGSRWTSLATLGADAIIALMLLPDTYGRAPGTGPWAVALRVPWIPQIGASFELGLDGLALALVLLTLFLGFAAVICSWTEIDDRVGFFHFNLLWTIAGVLGVFLALDLFLFFLFWEVMLVPMYFLIALWGHERRVYAAIKFFIFTQGSGLLMLVSIVALAFAHFDATGKFTFDYFALMGTPVPAATAMWIMLGFFAAFAVKLPVVPLHSWLPDAHTEAPTAGSVLLAGVLLKTGAYGLLRFAVPLFPHASAVFAPYAIALGVAGILYGAVLAFAQTDMKRLVAYTSVSHLGFVLLGIYAFDRWALHGAVMQIVAHGVTTGALFIIVGAMQERIHTRDMRRMSGLWTDAPRMGAFAMFFAIASLGLPGLGNFIGEFLVLLGVFRVDVVAASFGAVGVVLAAVYALTMIQRTFHGPAGPLRLRDTGLRETGLAAAMIAVIVWLGVDPQPLFTTVGPSLAGLEQVAGAPRDLADR